MEFMTPKMIKQFNDLKAKHPDVLMLFRCGDFYETYYDDAREASKVLSITLTKNLNGVPMAGFPHHASAFSLSSIGMRHGRKSRIFLSKHMAMTTKLGCQRSENGMRPAKDAYLSQSIYSCNRHRLRMQSGKQSLTAATLILSERLSAHSQRHITRSSRTSTTKHYHISLTI